MSLIETRIVFYPSQVLDGSSCAGAGVRYLHKLARNVAAIAGVVQRPQDTDKIQVACAGVPAIRVGHVEVEDAVARGADAGLNTRFLDIHVEGIEQQAEIRGADPPDEV